MGYQRITYEKKGPIATVTITAKARNAFSPQLHVELKDVFPKMEADPEVLATILTGDQAGKAFSAGADLPDPKSHVIESIGGHLDHIKEPNVFDALTDYSKPLIAAINGYALGAGFLITLCCDILIASENAEMGLPNVALGIIPAYGGGVRLARFVGKQNAMKLILTAERITAQEAYRMGIVSEVVPLPDLMPTAERIAGRIASLPPHSVRLAKESMNRGLDTPLKHAARADNYRTMALMLTEDRAEAFQAWREKREPTFKGE